jgi:signal transduction histidine kinase
LKREKKAQERSQRAVELLGSAIDVKINELTESNRHLKRKIFDLYTIFEISRNINSVLNYRTLVDSFLLTSLGQVGASSAALYLPQDGKSRILTLATSKGITDEDDARGRISLDGRLAAYLRAMAKPVMISELSDKFAESSDFSFVTFFENGMIIPLIFKSRLQGLMVLGRKVSGVGFAADDIEFLSILANQFVVALENARLYESEKNALKELQKTQRQLVLTERQAAIGELSAKIAHEVNNPLSIISNYLHLCGRSLDQPEKAEEHLDVARQELSRIARIVRQLLDFHRPQKTERVSIDVRELIDDILGLMEWQLVERKIDIERLADDPMPNVIGSAEQLKQVFLNLVINARDFMPEGGILKITTTNHDSAVKIKFVDTGLGIPSEHISRVFEPFFTTKEDSAGTGLGLSVCFGIIKEHGGYIVAGNEPEGGAIFEITLPAEPEDGDQE